MDNLITLLHQTPQTVFTMADLAIIWRETRSSNLRSKLVYYEKQRSIIRITRGIYAKNTNFDPIELAAKVYHPAYVSFETILIEAGIIFQHYETIFVATGRSRDMTFDQYHLKITFRKLKDEIVLNPLGIDHAGNYSKARPERAFLDMLYLFGEPYFDNLKPINWGLCQEIVPIYNNKRMIKSLNKYVNNYERG